MVFLSLCGMADEPVDPVVDALVAAHNCERKEEKLGPLKLSPTLCKSARAHARDMARHKSLITRGATVRPWPTASNASATTTFAWGKTSPKASERSNDVMSTWMKSPGHRANILAEFTEMGAARVEDDAGVKYWCVNFGIPMPRLEPDEAAVAVVKEINRQREAGRKVVLKAEPKLARAAMAISAAMAAKDSFETGSDPFKLIDAKDLEGRDIHLQLSANVPTPEKAAKELLGEQPDQLDGCREIGVGYALAKSGTPYWCAIFAKPVGNRARLRPR